MPRGVTAYPRSRSDRGSPRSVIGREAQRLGVTYHCVYFRWNALRRAESLPVKNHATIRRIASDRFGWSG